MNIKQQIAEAESKRVKCDNEKEMLTIKNFLAKTKQCVDCGENETCSLINVGTCGKGELARYAKGGFAGEEPILPDQREYDLDKTTK